MSDLEKIYSCLARMRNAMVKAHPENLGGSVSDALECALCLELFQKELLETITAAQKEIGLLHEAIGHAEHREVNLRKVLGNLRYPTACFCSTGKIPSDLHAAYCVKADEALAGEEK